MRVYSECSDVYTAACPRHPIGEMPSDAPDLAVKVCNTKQLGPFARCPLRLRKYDLIVVSHVAAAMIERVLSARCSGRRFHPRIDRVMFPESIAGRGGTGCTRLQAGRYAVGYRGRDVGARYGKRASKKV